MLKPSGSAPSVGAPGIQPRTESANAVSASKEAVTDVGRNDVTPRRARARAMPSSASRAAHGVVAAPAVDVDVDEAGRDGDVRRGARVVLDGRDAVILDDDVAGPHPVRQDEAA